MQTDPSPPLTVTPTVSPHSLSTTTKHNPMTESGNSATYLRPGTSPHPPRRRRRRRRCLAAVIFCLLLLLLVAIVALILALTVFKPRDPRTTLLKVRVDGVSPRISFPVVRVELNVTLDLDILIYNPNRASFAHAPGKTQLYYRGTQVGEADLEAGMIPSRGSEHVRSVMTVEADRFASELGNLVGDLLSGEVGIDASTRIPGRVTFLGIFKRHAVALSECHVGIGFPNLSVRRQDCKQETKL